VVLYEIPVRVIKQSLREKIAGKTEGDGCPSRGSLWTIRRLDFEAGFT
jgi:hypothetical protein